MITYYKRSDGVILTIGDTVSFVNSPYYSVLNRLYSDGDTTSGRTSWLHLHRKCTIIEFKMINNIMLAIVDSEVGNYHGEDANKVKIIKCKYKYNKYNRRINIINY